MGRNFLRCAHAAEIPGAQWRSEKKTLYRGKKIESFHKMFGKTSKKSETLTVFNFECKLLKTKNASAHKRKCFFDGQFPKTTKRNFVD